jgi:hypothetical protein
MSANKNRSADELKAEYENLMEGYHAPVIQFTRKQPVFSAKDRFVKFSLYNEQLRSVTSFETKSKL